YRNRTRMKVRGGADFAVGYHRLASHDLLPVKNCPISSPAINRVLQHLWEMGQSGRVPAGVTEIEFFADHADARILLEIYHAAGPPGVREFATELHARAADIRGTAIFAEGGGPHRPPQLKETLGNPALLYQVGEKNFRVSAGSFFQTNRHLVRELAQIVASDCFGKIVLDLYAAVGLFADHMVNRF